MGEIYMQCIFIEMQISPAAIHLLLRHRVSILQKRYFAAMHKFLPMKYHLLSKIYYRILESVALVLPHGFKLPSVMSSHKVKWPNLSSD